MFFGNRKRLKTEEASRAAGVTSDPDIGESTPNSTPPHLVDKIEAVHKYRNASQGKASSFCRSARSTELLWAPRNSVALHVRLGVSAEEGEGLKPAIARVHGSSRFQGTSAVCDIPNASTRHSERQVVRRRAKQIKLISCFIRDMKTDFKTVDDRKI